jgi:hypothetical protein
MVLAAASVLVGRVGFFFGMGFNKAGAEPDRVVLAICGESPLVSMTAAVVGVVFLFLPRVFVGGTGGVAPSVMLLRGSAAAPDAPVVIAAPVGVVFFFFPRALEASGAGGVAVSVALLLRGSAASPDVPVVVGTLVADVFLFLPWLFGGGNGRVGCPSSVMLLRRAAAASSSRVLSE